MKRLLITLVACLACAVSEAGDPEPPPPETERVSTLRSIRYHYANDIFTTTDYYFTQGMGLVWTEPALSQLPLAIPLPDVCEGALRQVSLFWRYEGFTPIDYEDRAIQLRDHPFASYMVLGARAESLGPDGEASLTAQWSLGYLGPRVGGEEFQTEIHRQTGDDKPEGWRNQIEDDLVAQLEIGYTRRLLGHELFDLQVEVELRGGTLYTDGSAGVRLRFGLLGAPLGAPDPEARAYLWVAAHGRAVGFNATLQGGVFNDSVFTLSANNVKRLVGAAQIGATVEYGFAGLSFSFTWVTPELNGGRSHAWGQLGLTMFFG